MIRKPSTLLSYAVMSLLLLASSSAHAQPAAFAEAKLAWTLPWDADWVTAVSFIGNNKVAAGNKLGGILVWNLPASLGEKAPPPARQLAGHTNEVTRLLTTPDQKTLISASLDHTIKYWDALSEIGEPGMVVLNARARYDAQERKKKVPVAVEAKVRVQKAERELTAHTDWVLGLSMTPDGKTLLSGADRTVGPKKEKEGEVIVWDLPAGKEVRRLKLKGWPWGLAISPDGQSALIAERIPLVFDSGARSGLKLWNVQT